jgi:hypothetical protein
MKSDFYVYFNFLKIGMIKMHNSIHVISPGRCISYSNRINLYFIHPVITYLVYPEYLKGEGSL